MTKIIDEPETENWSERNLRVECSNCSSQFAKWLSYSGLVGFLGYPYLVNRILPMYTGYEFKLLASALLIISTGFGTGYFAKIRCEENVKKLFSEGRREELEKQRQMSNNNLGKNFIKS